MTTSDRGPMRMQNVAGDAPIDTIGKGPKRDLPIEFESVNGLLDHMAQYVRDYWLGENARDKDDKNKQFMPMVTAVCANGDIVPMMVGTNFDEESKDDFVEMCQMNFQKWGVERYVFASEAWLACYDGSAAKDALDGGKPRLQPSQVEGRIEVVTIQAVDRDGSHAFAALEMVRDWQTGLVVELKEYQMERSIPPDMRDPTKQFKASGRFMSLLDGHKPPKNPMLNEHNMVMQRMFRSLLNAPEEMLRDQFAKSGADHKPLYDAGKALLAEMETCWQMLGEAKTHNEQRAVASVLNGLMLKARTHIMAVLMKGGINPNDLPGMMSGMKPRESAH